MLHTTFRILQFIQCKHLIGKYTLLGMSFTVYTTVAFLCIVVTQISQNSQVFQPCTHYVDNHLPISIYTYECPYLWCIHSKIRGTQHILSTSSTHLPLVISGNTTRESSVSYESPIWSMISFTSHLRLPKVRPIVHGKFYPRIYC